MTTLAGEFKEPSRTIPPALIGGVVTVMTIYLIVNLAYLYVLPIEEIVDSGMVAADAGQRVFGPAGSRMVAALVVLSTFGAITVSMMRGPRVYYAMAREDQFLRARFAYGVPLSAFLAAAPAVLADIHLIPAFEIYRQQSNLPNFDYNNYKVSLMITKRFDF